MRTEKGFSLIEILVAASLLSVLSLGMFQLVGFTNRQAIRNRQIGDFEDLASMARMVVSNTNLCRCNLTPGGGAARTFPAPAAGSTVYDLPSLSLYNESCAPAAKLVEPGSASVTELSLRDFVRVDDSNYVATLRLRARRENGSFAKDFKVALSTTTSGGTVTLNQCRPANQLDMVCQSVTTFRPVGAYSEDGLPGPISYVPRKCPRASQVMTACQAIQYPNGVRLCGTLPMAGRDPVDGKAFCTTSGCTPDPTERWGVTVTCCDLVTAS